MQIGYRAGITLLRAGAQLIVATRFARDAAQRYASEPAFYEHVLDAEQRTAEHRFHPPLDIVDGVARIVDPIIDGVNTGTHVWGQFPKDHRPTDW